MPSVGESQPKTTEDISSRKCAGCGKLASSLQCPKCLQLNILDSFFCDQDCFKRNWNTHKSVHKQHQTYDPFINAKGFKYTGSLRACYPEVAVGRRPIPSHIVLPDHAETGIPAAERKIRYSHKIDVLTPTEIAGMRKVCKMGREVLDIVAAAIRPGVTTLELDRICHEACVERDSYPSPLNYGNFPRSICTSINEVICHGIPDMRPLKDGDIINLDVSLYHGGLHADLNETYLVGNVDDAGRALVDCARECLKQAILQVKPGALYRDVGTHITRVATTFTPPFAVNKTFCGHGVGKLFHGNPSIPHYAPNKVPGTMKPGHVFTIEPMINEGTHRDEQWPDNWTAVTRDGKRSAQFEHTILVTETGYEVLTLGVGWDIVMDGLKKPAEESSS